MNVVRYCRVAQSFLSKGGETGCLKKQGSSQTLVDHKSNRFQSVFYIFFNNYFIS